MKTRLFFSFIAVLSLCLTACQNEYEEVCNPICDVPEADDMVIEIREKMPDPVTTTRVAYSGLSSSFETGDAIGIYAYESDNPISLNVRCVKQSDGSWKSDIKIPYRSNFKYVCYYPYKASHGYEVIPNQTTALRIFSNFTADADNVFWKADQSTKENFDASNLLVSIGTHLGYDNKVSFTMDHGRALAVFYGDISDAVFTGNIPYTMDGKKYFLMKPSTSTSFSDGSETYSLSADAGKRASHPIIISSTVTDLSMVDNAGNNRATMTTANCYLVHSAGFYKIPLVYGNAIKDGEVNTVAFNPGSGSNRLATFQNHAGNNITGPWITKSGSDLNAGMGLTAASAELLWQDASGGVIANVYLDGDYIMFCVETFRPGNALVAVKDGSGNILWSWHVWATVDDLSNTTVVSTGEHDYTVAPVNLGWVATGGSGKQGYCPYYQWGRKDPFIPCNGTTDGNTNKTVYSISGATITGITYSTSSPTIANNIKNPTTHYHYSTYTSPINAYYYNMWDAQNSSTNNVATATKKTVYDPCPPGFCVPTGNLWYKIGRGGSISTFDDTNKGVSWNTDITGNDLWFPATGYRNGNSSSLASVGSEGYYWCATPYNNKEGRGMALTSGRWWWNDYGRSNGFPVRPVVEE
jgi:hypothetical protein